jgi:hypothetical protein
VWYVLAQYWPYLLGSLLIGIAVGWFAASPAGRVRKTPAGSDR